MRRAGRDHTVEFDGKSILTTVTNDSKKVEVVLSELRVSLAANTDNNRVVGVDIKYKSNPSSNNNSTIATLQLCYGIRCLVIPLLMLDSIPKSLLRFFDDASIPNSLTRFLDDASITFIGVDVSCGFAKLAGEYDRLPAIPEKKCLELGVMVDKVRDTSHLNRYSNLGLSELVAEILHGVYLKPDGVAQADWGIEVLTDEQVKYATLHAYVPLAIMNKLSTEGINFFYLYEKAVMQWHRFMD